jgi:hypothetical protein
MVSGYDEWMPYADVPTDDLDVAENDAAFLSLARNAFDVMMRRHWEPEQMLAEKGQPWGVDSAERQLPTRLVDMRWPDPFTALVEADKWFREQEANKA